MVTYDDCVRLDGTRYKTLYRPNFTRQLPPGGIPTIILKNFRIPKRALGIGTTPTVVRRDQFDCKSVTNHCSNIFIPVTVTETVSRRLQQIS